MKRIAVVVLSVVSASQLFADAGQRLVPAGSLVGCTISEPRLSSKNTAIGDPVLCRVGHSERYGRSVMPYDSYLVGRFEDYKDPGHFVGKGWMELKFDRMVIEPDTVIPIDARVVDAPGYRVDSQGRILGKGHATRDIVLWTIPILWPVDLLMLPMRGPRPTLKEETRLTLKVMDDLAVPVTTPPSQDIYGLTHRQPTAENDPPPVPDQVPDQEPAPETAYAPQPAPLPQPPAYAYPAPVVMPPPPVVAYAPMAVAPPAVSYGYAPGAYGARVYSPGPYGARAAAPRPYGYRGYRSPGYGGGRAPGYGYRAPSYATAPRAYARPAAARAGYGGGSARGGWGYGGGRR